MWQLKTSKKSACNTDVGNTSTLFIGTRYTVLSDGVIQMSDYTPTAVTSSQLQAYGQQLQKVVAKHCDVSKWSGTIRIRPNGDTYAKVKSKNIYVGRTKMNGEEPFVGYGINVQSHQVFTGTHNCWQVGEKWSIPDFRWARTQNKTLHIGRKQKSDGWLWSIKEYPNFIRDMHKRFGTKGFTTLYVTQHGHMLKPVDPEDVTDVQQQLLQINQDYPASMNSMKIRIQNGGRKHKTVYIVVGNIQDYPELTSSIPILK
jgi:hypothetical protein